MNEERKQSELTEEDLQQVSGGVTVEVTAPQKVADTEAVVYGPKVKKEIVGF
jgi:bacteriocin-like protein